MARVCTYCEDRQYCLDCLSEQGKLRSQRHHPQRQKIRICGKILHYEGRAYRITKKEVGSPNIKLFTKEGFLFLIREKNEKISLIKVIPPKGKKQKKKECKDCYDILLGQSLPSRLLKDPNW